MVDRVPAECSREPQPREQQQQLRSSSRERSPGVFVRFWRCAARHCREARFVQGSRFDAWLNRLPVRQGTPLCSASHPSVCRRHHPLDPLHTRTHQEHSRFFQTSCASPLRVYFDKLSLIRGNCDLAQQQSLSPESNDLVQSA